MIPAINGKRLAPTRCPSILIHWQLIREMPNTIYAGTWYRPFKTTDGGKSWKLINTGMIDDSDVFAINLDNKNPDHMIASACSGIYESFNGGENWSKFKGIPSDSRRTRDILQHPSRPGNGLCCDN